MVDEVVKITGIHVIAAIVAAVLSTMLAVGTIGFKNDVFAGVIGIIIVYFIGQLCQHLYGESIKGFSQWLWDGILPFLFVWIIVWTILLNYGVF